MFVQCPYCHKKIARESYAAHEKEHERRKPDGQHTDHVTNAPDQRYKGSLAGVPQSYRHARCGRGTRMPEEIIRTYLVNPLAYVDRTFCTGCGDYVDGSELTWIETGENMMDYKGRLRADYLERTYGISRAAQQKQVVVVTPRGAEAISVIGQRLGLTPPCSLMLKLVLEQSKSNYVCRVAGDWDPDIEMVLPSGKVQIIVPKDQVELLRGTIVHYATPPVQGFLMCRLYARKKRG